MRSSFWSLISSSFLTIQGPLIGFMGLILSILLWWFPVNTQIPIGLSIGITVFLVVVIATFWNAAYIQFKNYTKLEKEYENLKSKYIELESKVNKWQLPKIIVAQKEQTGKSLNVSCLLEKSDLLSHGAWISFYLIDNDEFERLIGIGVVVTVQANELIQALMDQPTIGYEDIWDKLTNNDAQVLTRIIVKPNVNRNMIQAMNKIP